MLSKILVCVQLSISAIIYLAALSIILLAYLKLDELQDYMVKKRRKGRR